MITVPEWLGAGLLTAGVSAAVLAGAGVATADAEGDSDASARASATTSAEADPDTSSTDAGPRVDDDPVSTEDVAADVDDEVVDDPDRGTQRDPELDEDTEAPDVADIEIVAPDEESDAPAQRGASSNADETAPEATDLIAVATPPTVPESSEATNPAAGSAAASGGVGDILGPFQPDYPPLVRAVGSAVFNLIGALVQIVDGPPTVPWELRDSIRVSSSTLTLSPGNKVPADWYFPKSGQPERLIYLQHGILASGPMYSHTAAYLAERTNSIVVATTLTSNPFADNGIWLGGDNMHKAVAQLFLDDGRTALNASFGTATRRIGAPNLVVPTEFVLVGHSLGGGFAPGVGGHYAQGLVARRADGQDAPNHLAGVTVLDGVPFSPIMPNAMDRFEALEDSGGGDPADYVPVYQIGAPLNFLNDNSKINQELPAARPGKFNGVVVDDGVHMDGMLGANPLIQAAAYLVAGIPKKQNPLAVQLLMAGWINDMFDGAIDPESGRCLGTACAGQYGSPGETIVIATEKGEASAVVIGSATSPAVKRSRADRFAPPDASSVVWPPTLAGSIPLRIVA